MGFYINKGNGGFRQTRNGEYVDKSGLIGFVNSVLNTNHKFLCCTRARRFGKTLAAEMLYAYYDKSCDSRELFEDLKIAGHPSYEEHLNKYPAIFLDISKFIDRTDNILNLIEDIERKISDDLAEAYPDVERPAGGRLAEFLGAIAKRYSEKFIVIIDEWDAPLRELQSKFFPFGDGSLRRLTSDEVAGMQDSYVAFLRGMFKNDETAEIFAGVYITGILPIIRYNTQSALNNFKEYNLISPEPIGEYLGFTEEEVQELCRKYDMDYGELKAWYDGYQVGDSLSVFNPNSVMTALSKRKCRSYWTATGAGDELAPYLRNELREDVQRLLDGDCILVNTHSFDNNLDDINTRDKLFTALIHLGYLSYDGYRARIPNTELLLYFGDNIQEADLGGLSKVLGRSQQLVFSLIDGKEAEAAEILGRCHDDICGAQEYNSEQSLYTTLRESLFFAHRDYVFHREYPTGKGFADLVLIPRPGSRFPAMVIELKNGRSAASALAQIQERNYPAKVAEYSGEMLLAGISYDPLTKEHECSIERLSK